MGTMPDPRAFQITLTEKERALLSSLPHYPLNVYFCSSERRTGRSCSACTGLQRIYNMTTLENQSVIVLGDTSVATRDTFS